MTPDYTASFPTSHSGEKMPVSLKNALDEAANIIDFIKSRPLNTGFENIISEEM